MHIYITEEINLKVKNMAHEKEYKKYKIDPCQGNYNL